MIDAVLLAAVVETTVETVREPGVLLYIQAVAAAFFMIAGTGFVLAGSLGVLRLPDFYTRLHAAGMTDTLGAEAILFGLIIQTGFTLVSLKLALVGFFLLITSPTATHAIAHAAWSAKLEPLTGPWSAPTPDTIKARAQADAEARR